MDRRGANQSRRGPHTARPPPGTGVDYMAITLSQRSALVTGSSRGIGRGIALKLAEAGVKRIAINYVENDGAAKEPARLVRERGAEPLLLKANVGDVDQLKAMFAKVKETWDS